MPSTLNGGGEVNECKRLANTNGEQKAVGGVQVEAGVVIGIYRYNREP